MAHLIDISYFVSVDLNIPDAGTGTQVDQQIAQVIDVREAEFLRGALGNTLYRVFVNGLGLSGSSYTLVANGVAADTVDTRWKNLLNGVEYTDPDGRLQVWNGFVSLNRDGRTTGRSIIAHYVYYWYRRAYVTATQKIGETIAKAENANVVSPWFKVAGVWNEMSREIKQLVQYLRVNQALYPEWLNSDGDQTLRKFGYMNPFF